MMYILFWLLLLHNILKLKLFGKTTLTDDWKGDEVTKRGGELERKVMGWWIVEREWTVREVKGLQYFNWMASFAP